LHPFYELLDVDLRGATQTIGADSASPEDARLLEIPVGSPVLRCERITTDVQGIAGGVEAAIHGKRSAGEALTERVEVGAIGQQATPLDVFDQGHAMEAQQCPAWLVGAREKRAASRP
jgi:hypothetical protein